MDELAAMRVFTRVVQMGSFSKVARHLETSTSSVTDQRVDLVAERVDVAIWRGKLDHDSRLVARMLGTQRLVVCASPEYPARHGTPTSPAELADHNCLVFTAPHHVPQWVFEKDGATMRMPVAGNLKCDTSAGMLAAVRAGLGITLMPLWVVRDLCAQGTLVTVMDDHDVSQAGIDVSLYIVYPHRQPSPKVAAFIEFVPDLFEQAGTSAPRIAGS